MYACTLQGIEGRALLPLTLPPTPLPDPAFVVVAVNQANRFVAQAGAVHKLLAWPGSSL